jgi:DNA-binding GntR family transcriptional regulator
MDSIPTAATSQERAYNYLRDRILNLHYKPNEALRTQTIAAEIELSRTPVREALSRLEQAGLVARAGGWGYTVRAISYKEAMDIYRVREALEVEAVAEALPQIDTVTLRELRSHLKAAEDKLRQRRIKEFRDNTRRFHRGIARATDNSFLVSMLMTIEDRVHLLGAIMADNNRDRPSQSLRENHALLAALEGRDEGAAVSAVRKHVCSAREAVTRFRAGGGHLTP